MLPLCTVLGSVQEGAGSNGESPKEGHHSDQGPGAALRLRGCLDWGREARGDPTHGDTSHREDGVRLCSAAPGQAREAMGTNWSPGAAPEEAPLCWGGGLELAQGAGRGWGLLLGVSDPSWEPWDGWNAAALSLNPSAVPCSSCSTSRPRQQQQQEEWHNPDVPQPEPGTELSTKGPTALWHCEVTPSVSSLCSTHGLLSHGTAARETSKL